MKNKNCEHDVSVGLDVFCGECGVKVEATAVCECGTPTHDKPYCWKCGKKQ